MEPTAQAITHDMEDPIFILLAPISQIKFIIEASSSVYPTIQLSQLL